MTSWWSVTHNQGGSKCPDFKWLRSLFELIVTSRSVIYCTGGHTSWSRHDKTSSWLSLWTRLDIYLDISLALTLFNYPLGHFVPSSFLLTFGRGSVLHSELGNVISLLIKKKKKNPSRIGLNLKWEVRSLRLSLDRMFFAQKRKFMQ